VKNKSEKYSKERGLPCWEDVVVQRDFKPLYVSEAI